MMLRLLDLVGQITVCMMIGSINGKEFVIIPIEGHEILVPPFNSEVTKHREFYRHANPKPHHAALRSEGYEIFPTHESEYQNHQRHLNVRFARPPISVVQKERKRIVGNIYPDRPLLPVIDQNRTRRKDNNLFAVSSKPVLRNSSILCNSSEIMKNVSSKTIITVNSGSGTTISNGNVTNDIEVSVDDRASFNGDQCPKGHIKVQGKCVPPD